MNCPNCNAVIADGHRFCTECGYKVVEPQPEPVAVPEETETEVEESVVEMENVENHIMWNVQPGQVARLIPEKEFSQYSDAAGLIVNEGARVLIRTNADDLTMISSGIYKFPKPYGAPKPDSRSFLGNIFNSAGKGEVVPPAAESCSLLLVRDGDFPVIFAGAASNADEYVPMTIPAKNLDVNVGVSAMLRIGSMQQFAARYMLDRTNMTVVDLVKAVSPKVEKVLREVLADVVVAETGLTDVVKEEISDRLKSGIGKVPRP